MSVVKQFILERIGPPEAAFRLVEGTMPTLKEDGLLVKVEGFGLNFADIMARYGKYREAPPFPFVPGYEIVGVVQEVGPQCSSAWIGKRIAGFCRFGGYSNYVEATPSSIVEVGNCNIGDSLSLCTQGVTAAYMVDHIPKTSEEGYALVHSAAGGVGNLLVQLLHQRKIKTIGKIRNNQKAKCLENLPLDHIIISDNNHYHKSIKEKIGDSGLMAVFNPLGGKTIKEDLNRINPGGQLFLYGGATLLEGKLGIFSLLNFVRKSGFFSPIPLMMGSKSLVGVNVLKIADANPMAIKNYLSECFENYKKKILQPLKSTGFPSTKFNEAQSLLESGESTGKIYVYWEDF